MVNTAFYATFTKLSIRYISFLTGSFCLNWRTIPGVFISKQGTPSRSVLAARNHRAFQGGGGSFTRREPRTQITRQLRYSFALGLFTDMPTDA
jgi:hypothetical protein